MATSSISRALLRPSLKLVSEINLAGRQMPVNSILRRNMVSATSFLMEERTMKLPGLGDSITEGTIVEWTAAVGQAVKEGDVVAMVETDKVTVDIKAEIDGVITEHFSAVDDNIEVGENLYKIDTDAEASVAAAETSDSTPAPEPAAPSTTPPPAAEEVKQVAATTSSPSQRTPSIQFLGKEGWAKRRAGIQTPTLVYIPAMYGRPYLSQEEMDALETGGASLVPKVTAHSTGAMFG